MLNMQIQELNWKKIKKIGFEANFDTISHVLIVIFLILHGQPSLQAFRAETMVDDLPRTYTFVSACLCVRLCVLVRLYLSTALVVLCVCGCLCLCLSVCVCACVCLVPGLKDHRQDFPCAKAEFCRPEAFAFGCALAWFWGSVCLLLGLFAFRLRVLQF